MLSAQVILSVRCWFFYLFFFKLIMLPEGSSKHCAADKFSLFSKAFLSISNAPLWQVEGKHTKFCGRAVFPALRCQKTSKRSFFTSKKIDRFGYVTQPDQASVPCVYEYKWSGRINQRWFTSGPQGRNVISKSLRFFCVCVCALKTACREFQNQTDLLDLASDEKNTGFAALPVAFCPEIYSSNVRMSWTPPTARSFSQHWHIGLLISVGPCAADTGGKRSLISWFTRVSEI